MRRGDFQTSKVRFCSKAGPSCEKNSFYWCKTTQTISYDFIKILVQKISKMGSKMRSQPLQSKEIKISSTVWFTGFTRGLSSRQWIFNKTSKASTFVQLAKKQRKHPDKRFPNCKSKKGFLGCVAFWSIKKEFLIGQRSHLKPPSRDLARTVYTAENLIFTSYSATIRIQRLWVKIGK